MLAPWLRLMVRSISQVTTKTSRRLTPGDLKKITGAEYQSGPPPQGWYENPVAGDADIFRIHDPNAYVNWLEEKYLEGFKPTLQNPNQSPGPNNPVVEQHEMSHLFYITDFSDKA
jgi:hypothetical protein